MHFSAHPDKPAASCVICAKQLPDRDQACPYCGEGPFMDEGPAEDDDWLNAMSASDESASDPVLDAMMAIAAPKALLAEGPRSVLLAPSEQMLEQPPSSTGRDVSQQATTPHRPVANRRLDPAARRMIFGGVVLAIAAGLTGAQWQWHGPAGTQSREATPVPRDIGPLAQATPPAVTPTPHREFFVIDEPAPAPTAEAAPAPTSLAPDAASRSATCSEALMALALCREPL